MAAPSNCSALRRVVLAVVVAVGVAVGGAMLTSAIGGSSLAAQQSGPRAAAAPSSSRTPALPVSAPVSDLHYTVSFDSAGVAQRTIAVVTTMRVGGRGPVVLALPGWTPGAYEMGWFARWVTGFSATGESGPLAWDKVDYQTWRIEPGASRSITVTFSYSADSLDNANTWIAPNGECALINGTTLFLYPVGRGLDFPASVTVRPLAGWRVVTGMTPGRAAGSFTASSYHDLVDMPFLTGLVDLDSLRIVDRWVRIAAFPIGTLTPERRATIFAELAKLIPPESAVFHDTPWTSYTILQIADPSYPGASGLEHQNSHVDVIAAAALDNAFVPGLYAHEIFHSWNVKRLRPADMVPYRYEAPEPTPWLWVSEGITDYYADLAQVRGGVFADSVFLRVTAGKIAQVAAAPPTALTDASLTTWIQPTNGTADLYYPKGSLAGLLLDIEIRDGSDNHRSLDDVMRELYETTYKHGRGFTADEWWRAVGRAAGGRSFAEFDRRYVDGRDAYPYAAVFALAGLHLVDDTVRQVRLGVATEVDSAGAVRVLRLVPASAAADGGIHAGDVLVSVGDIVVSDATFGERFRAAYGTPGSATTVPVVVRRLGARLTLQVPLRYESEATVRLDPDPAATPRAVRIREGILRGRTDASG